MRLIGLTGGIGSGKSTVSNLLAARGAVIIDADAITRELQQPGQPVLAAIEARFGPNVLLPDGSLDRAGLAAIVFADPEALKDLNGIVHPAVGAEILRRIEVERAGANLVVLDIPLLVEGGRYSVQAVVVVDLPEEVAVERLVSQRAMVEADARARMARQASRDDRLAKADHVVDNSGSPEALAVQVAALWDQLVHLPELDPQANPRTQ